MHIGRISLCSQIIVDISILTVDVTLRLRSFPIFQIDVNDQGKSSYLLL